MLWCVFLLCLDGSRVRGVRGRLFGSNDAGRRKEKKTEKKSISYRYVDNDDGLTSLINQDPDLSVRVRIFYMKPATSDNHMASIVHSSWKPHHSFCTMHKDDGSLQICKI